VSAQPSPVRPFSEFPCEAAECDQALRWFQAAGQLMVVRCKSLWDVCRKLCEASQDAPSYSSLRLVLQSLAKLLRLSFGRNIEVYRTRWPNGGSVIGLTEEGRVALRLTVEFLAKVDDCDSPA
jgi:hypothetical protein